MSAITRRQPLAHSIAAQVYEYLASRPDGATIAQLSTALGQPMSLIKSRLDMHAETASPRVRRDGLRWYATHPKLVEKSTPKPVPVPAWRKAQRGSVAGPRERVVSGTYEQPRPFVRPGAEDYKAIPSRFGSSLIPYGQ